MAKGKNKQMHIRINDFDIPFEIQSDDYNYTLYEVRTNQDGKNKGEEYLVAFGYYPTMTHLFKSWYDLLGKRNASRTLEGYVKHMNKITKQFEKILMGFAKEFKDEGFDEVMTKGSNKAKKEK